MRRVYILRHGIAVPHGSAEYRDDDRPLTPKGIARIKRVARGLAAIRVEVDRVVTSPLPRALATARIVAEALDGQERLETADVLAAGRPVEMVARWLAEQQDMSLMIVGHNPVLSQLVALLVLDDADLTPFELRCGAVAALVAGSRGGPYEIDWIARPKLLKRVRG